MGSPEKATNLKCGVTLPSKELDCIYSMLGQGCEAINISRVIVYAYLSKEPRPVSLTDHMPLDWTSDLLTSTMAPFCLRRLAFLGPIAFEDPLLCAMETPGQLLQDLHTDTVIRVPLTRSADRQLPYSRRSSYLSLSRRRRHAVQLVKSFPWACLAGRPNLCKEDGSEMSDVAVLSSPGEHVTYQIRYMDKYITQEAGKGSVWRTLSQNPEFVGRRKRWRRSRAEGSGCVAPLLRVYYSMERYYVFIN